MDAQKDPLEGIPFSDVPVKKFFYLERRQKTPICFKIDENRYSCTGITDFCEAEKIVYLAPPLQKSES